MPRLLAAIAVLAVFLAASISVVQAQSTAPTVSTVAVTSDPGTDTTYETGDTITVTLTFSEAVTVDTTGGTPRITVTLTFSETEPFEGSLAVPGGRGGSITEIVLDVRTPSNTLDVTIRLVNGTQKYTGSVATAGLQTFTISTPTTARRGIVPTSILARTIEIRGSGTGTVELNSAYPRAQDPGGVSGWRVSGESAFFDDAPQIAMRGHAAGIPSWFRADVVSSPANGMAYAAGERIEIRYLFPDGVDIPEDLVVPIWLGDGAEHRREATLWSVHGPTRDHPNSAFYGFMVAYTVQPGDTDTDGIYIAANPLGDNADVGFTLSGHDDVPADLMAPAMQLGTEHAVDGSNAYDCLDAHCSTMVVHSCSTHGLTALGSARMQVTGYFSAWTASCSGSAGTASMVKNAMGCHTNGTTSI